MHPTYRLIVAANRDEFYERPTAPAHFWEDAPHVLAGRDLLKMGTWMGVTTSGRFAALTNYRDPAEETRGRRSRGEVVANFLKGTASPEAFVTDASRSRTFYPGYNLLAGDLQELYYYSNVADDAQKLQPGIYGVSNHLLDTPWPKVERGKAGLAEAIRESGEELIERLFDVLRDAEPAPDERLPSTGVPLEWERLLSPIFIRSPERGYGTRSSTVIIAGDEAIHVRERVVAHERAEERRFDVPVRRRGEA